MGLSPGNGSGGSGGHPQKGQSQYDCQQIAEAGGGAKSYDEFGTVCWNVYGKAIQINPLINSVMEGAMITNVNFNASAIPAIGNLGDLGITGQSNGDTGGSLGSPGWSTDSAQYNVGA